MFIDQEAEAEEQSQFPEADLDNEATGVRLLPGFQGYASSPAGRGMKDLGDLLGEDERR